MIIVVSGGVLLYTKDMPVVKKNRVQERNSKAALNLVREYYGDNTLKRKDVRPTKLVDFEGIARNHNVNIMLYEPNKDRGKDAGSIWRLLWQDSAHNKHGTWPQ